MTGAGNETRTRDPDLGKVVLYQLSYSRTEAAHFSWSTHSVKLCDAVPRTDTEITLRRRANTAMPHAGNACPTRW